MKYIVYMENYYQTLGLASYQATDVEIRAAFRKSALKLHPDKRGVTIDQSPSTVDDDVETIEDKVVDKSEDPFVRLLRAKDTLLDPFLRKKYNAALQGSFRLITGVQGHRRALLIITLVFLHV